MAKILLIGGALDGSSHVLPAHLERTGEIFTVAEMPPISALVGTVEVSMNVPLVHHYRVYVIKMLHHWAANRRELFIGHSPDIDPMEALVSMMQFYEENAQ